MDVAAYTNKLSSFLFEKFRSHRIFCDRILDFRSGQLGVISNGKVCVEMFLLNHSAVILVYGLPNSSNCDDLECPEGHSPIASF